MQLVCRILQICRLCRQIHEVLLKFIGSCAQKILGRGFSGAWQPRRGALHTLCRAVQDNLGGILFHRNFRNFMLKQDRVGPSALSAVRTGSCRADEEASRLKVRIPLLHIGTDGSGLPAFIRRLLYVATNAQKEVFSMAESQRIGTARHALLLRLTLTGVFTALAVVAKLYLSVSIPFLGAGGMRIGLTGVITAFPAILFGPFYGGAASMICDLAGHLIKPEGAYIPWLTLTAFAGGFLKGVLWRLLGSRRMDRKKLLGGVSAVCALFLTLGAAVHISLASDGVTRGFLAVQKELPARGVLEKTELSPLSRFVTGLAQYNRDQVTLCKMPDGETVEVPEKVLLDGVSCNVTKIGKQAFSACERMTQCIIPASVKSIDEEAFGERRDVLICGKEDSAAQKFADQYGFAFRAADTFSGAVPEFSDGATEKDGVSVKSSDTYRKYLAGYINFATVGLELVGLLGLLAVAVSLVAGKRKTAGDCFAEIALTVSAAGVAVTTVNTWILMRYLTAWHGRPFLILWVPRVLEELVVCTVQAYLIAILYDICRNRKLLQKIP